jgi:hypothetical protein
MYDSAPLLSWLALNPREGIDQGSPSIARAIRRVRMQGRASDRVIDRIGVQFGVPDLLEALYPANE